jgi:hypothetical protein
VLGGLLLCESWKYITQVSVPRSERTGQLIGWPARLFWDFRVDVVVGSKDEKLIGCQGQPRSRLR